MRKIEGFENYLVASSGRVFSLRNNKYLKSSPNARGYYLVGLYHKGKMVTKYVHRLVAEAFLCSTDNKAEVNHKDANKANNDKSNLEWVTHKENIHHAIGLGLSPQLEKANGIAVCVYDCRTGNFKSTHSSISEAAWYYGVGISHISKVLKGKCKHAKGLMLEKIAQ